MNYAHESRLFQFNETQEQNRAYINQLLQEAAYMIDVLETGNINSPYQPHSTIAMEAGESTVKKAAGGVKNFFKRIIEFLKNIFKKFGEKVGILSKSNTAWIKENRIYLDKLDEKGVEIEMTPYWKNMSSIKKLLVLNGDMQRMIAFDVRDGDEKRYNTVDNIKSSIYKAYLDEDNRLNEGIKNIARTGSPRRKSETVSLAGEQLKSLINSTFIPYIESYETKVMSDIKSLMVTITSRLEKAESVYNRKKEAEGVSESAYCVLENTTYDNSSISPFFTDIIFEARTKTDKDIKKANETESPAKVKVVTHGSDDEQKANSASENLSTNKLTVVKNALTVAQNILTTCMTIFEEIHIAYMNALKSVVDAFQKKKDKTDEEKVQDAKAATNPGI